MTPDPIEGCHWAKLLATLRASGRAMPIKHSLIAATASFTVWPLPHSATGNRTDFEKAGIEIVDPFTA